MQVRLAYAVAKARQKTMASLKNWKLLAVLKAIDYGSANILRNHWQAQGYSLLPLAACLGLSYLATGTGHLMNLFALRAVLFTVHKFVYYLLISLCVICSAILKGFFSTGLKQDKQNF